jgi:superfamily II DNA or RNA helicase
LRIDYRFKSAIRNPQSAIPEEMDLTFDGGTLLLDEVPRGVKIPGCFRWDGRVDRWRAQAFRYRAVIEELRKNQVAFKDKVKRYRTLQLASRIKQTPHPHQSEAIAAWQQSGGCGVIELPTGSGKSYVAQLAIEAMQRSTLVVAPTLDLLAQWYDLLSATFDQEVGIIGGGYYEIRDLTVTTYDSAHMHMERIGNQWGLLVFDECHHLPGPFYSHAAEMCIAPYRMGLTATLERADGQHARLDELIGPVVYRKNIRELAGEFLAEYTVRHLSVELTAEERERYKLARNEYVHFLHRKGLDLRKLDDWKEFIKLSARDTAGRRAMLAYQESKRIAQGTEAKLHLLDGLLKQHGRDRVLVFTADNDTVYTISRTFLVPAITHQTDIKERKEILQGFNKGYYQALVTSKVLNEGVNIPEANVAIVLSGSASVREHVQRLGRILRQRQGKRAILYEVVTLATFEERTSQRRREHDAYR